MPCVVTNRRGHKFHENPTDVTTAFLVTQPQPNPKTEQPSRDKVILNCKILGNILSEFFV